MHNYNNISYINNKIINIQSEILFREAEDDLFYFNKINSAYKKLQKGIKLTPCHYKSIMLLADICIIKGYYNKALNLYKEAEHICDSFKISASICNCYYLMKMDKEALKYCEKALQNFDGDNFLLYSQITEIKVNILINLKLYKKAYKTVLKSKNIIDAISLKNIYNTEYELLNGKINLQKKIKYSGLKIV